VFSVIKIRFNFSFEAAGLAVFHQAFSCLMMGTKPPRCGDGTLIQSSLSVLVFPETKVADTLAIFETAFPHKSALLTRPHHIEN